MTNLLMSGGKQYVILHYSNLYKKTAFKATIVGSYFKRSIPREDGRGGGLGKNLYLLPWQLQPLRLTVKADPKL